jgi:uncharacterized protein
MSAMTATIQALTGDRWHLSHGPIDVVLKASGPPHAVMAATKAALERFPSILPELVSELPTLRRAVTADGEAPTSPVAVRMWAACVPHAETFVTAMAAVAGAVADELLDEMLRVAPDLETVFVNDGGDIALFCAPGHTLTVGLAGWPGDAVVPGYLDPSAQETAGRSATALRATARFGAGRHGIATSGARGRSFSLGVADAVTVVANSAAAADTAATLIANAVNVAHPAIKRRKAIELDPDSDLGDLSVTVSVPALPECSVASAIALGAKEARRMIGSGLIRAAILTLQGQTIDVTSSEPFLTRLGRV